MRRVEVQSSLLFFDLGCMPVNWDIAGGTAKHYSASITAWFCFATVRKGADTAMPGGLHARLCHAFLVL